MKTISLPKSRRQRLTRIVLLDVGVWLIGSLSASAQDTAGTKPADDKKAVTEKQPAKPDEPASEYSNWITLGVGSTFISGDKAQFMQRNQIRKGPFGGVEDFHWERGEPARG